LSATLVLLVDLFRSFKGRALFAWLLPTFGSNVKLKGCELAAGLSEAVEATPLFYKPAMLGCKISSNDLYI